jgi:DNA-directed RNA polymerase subunit RPC12/RpoP
MNSVSDSESPVKTIHNRSYKCTRCNRALKDPKSVERGMGPVCARKQAFDDAQKQDGIPEQINADLATDGIVFQRGTDGTALTNIPHLHRHHSPTGFEWGYGGSGPADLALNVVQVMLQRMGYKGPRLPMWDKSKCFELAWELHQEFKEEFIAPVDRYLGGSIPLDRIETWLRVRMALSDLENAPDDDAVSRD